MNDLAPTLTRVQNARMIAQPEVRTATCADAQAIADIGAPGFAQAHERILPQIIIDTVVEQTYSVDALRDCIAGCAADDDALFLVAELDDRVVGYVHYDSAGPEPELHRIYVAPGMPGSGIGTTLLGELHRRLPGGTSYILMVAEENAGAVRFYERHGFTRDATIDGIPFYRQHMGVAFPPDAAPVPALIMRRTA